jgi:hypothetical protein
MAVNNIVTLTIQKQISARNDSSYQNKLDKFIQKLERLNVTVDVTSEDNAAEVEALGPND